MRPALGRAWRTNPEGVSRPNTVPVAIAPVPFTRSQARACGVSPDMLRGKRFRTLFRGVHICASVDVTLDVWLHAALLVLPADAAVSHVTALWLHGVEIRKPWPLHFSTNTALVSSRANIILHRRKGRLSPLAVRELLALGPDRSFVDCATVLNPIELVQTGDWLLHLNCTDLSTLSGYVNSRHLDGVLRARRWLAYVRERVESPMETFIRLLVIFARLPEPETNRDIFDARGGWITRGDMPYFDYKVLLEYDGQWHERSQKQRQRDRERRELLEAQGWRLIVVTSEDLKNKQEIAWRVYRALRERGYTGREPIFNTMWTTWFA